MGKVDETITDMWRKGVWVWPLLTIHDAVMVEAEDKYAKESLEIIRDIMDSVMDDEETGERRFRVPIESDGEVMDRWQKD
jgi:DNA polymerase I-like protein with 3'-5' exonuclease and polymerase domains